MDHKKFAKKMELSTLLYIEDDEQLRKHFTEFLSRYSQNVYACEDAQAGMALYEEIKPDIILLDINLPGMNGIEFAKKIRQKEKFTRIIIFTAYTDKEFLLEAIELELTRYLVKPVTSQELFDALEKSLLELEEFNEKYMQVTLKEGFVYSVKSKTLLKDGQEIILRKKELDMLKFFIANEGKTISYETLEHVVWKSEVMSRDAIRSQIKNLRRKTYATIIENISGVGYRLRRA